LTGLPNRTLFHDRTTLALEAIGPSGGEIAVMLVDLDRFKEVNDTLGHQYGDVLLQQVAHRFTASLRASDSVARLGGDEFAVLLPNSSAEEAIEAAQRLTDGLREPFAVKDISLNVDASIGIALARSDADVESVLRHADVAMYEAKAQNEPYATYTDTRDDHSVARLALLGDLRRGIAGGELVLHFQPKVDAVSGVVHSVEALVRWRHPTRGLLGPVEFIPMAENTAVIHALTDEVLRLALTQSRTWISHGIAVPVCVNISVRSLLTRSFPDHVRTLLDTHDIPAALLTLEITESSIMTDPGRAREVLEALDTMGVRLSIDDFGTGYSSMAYLKALPFRELKIDRAFVSSMLTDHSDRALVQLAIDLGHTLGLDVVAEGVEDTQTTEALAAMGCDLVQGYHVHCPDTAAELEPWLHTQGVRVFAPASTH
jgi:diguanylate cyclase (GGDEF)-like protein